MEYTEEVRQDYYCAVRQSTTPLKPFKGKPCGTKPLGREKVHWLAVSGGEGVSTGRTDPLIECRLAAQSSWRSSCWLSSSCCSVFLSNFLNLDLRGSKINNDRCGSNCPHLECVQERFGSSTTSPFEPNIYRFPAGQHLQFDIATSVSPQLPPIDTVPCPSAIASAQRVKATMEHCGSSILRLRRDMETIKA